MVLENVRHLFQQPMDKKIKTWTLPFPAKGNLVCYTAVFSVVTQRCCVRTLKTAE